MTMRAGIWVCSWIAWVQTSCWQGMDLKALSQQKKLAVRIRWCPLRGPADGRYKLAFIEFGDQGSALDTSQRAAALGMIRETDRPLLFVYIHGWQNNAESGDVCRFEHFLDSVSRFPAITGRKI